MTLWFLYGLRCTRWSLYEMIPRRVFVKIRVPLRTKKSLYEVTPMLLYEVVSLVRNGLCSKWSLYEVTWHHFEISSGLLMLAISPARDNNYTLTVGSMLFLRLLLIWLMRPLKICYIGLEVIRYFLTISLFSGHSDDKYLRFYWVFIA